MRMPHWPEVSIVKTYTSLSKESKLREETVPLPFDKNAHTYRGYVLLCVHHFYEASYILNIYYCTYV